MSFLPGVHREIARRPPRDPVRLTLEYMVQHAVGRRNAVPLPTIVAHLRSMGTNISETGFQQTVLAAEFLEDLVTIKWGKLARLLFADRQRRLELMEAEMSAPGRQLAYIALAREKFGSASSRT